jgi:hypothetical protein
MQKSLSYSAAALALAAVAAGFAAIQVLRAKTGKRLHDDGDAQGGRRTQDYSDQQNWPADENIKPVPGGGFEPAYSDNDPKSTNIA